MSHYTVLATKTNKVSVEEQMARLTNVLSAEYTNEYGERTTINPKAKWDWYTVGGRWSDTLGGEKI